MIPFKRLSTPFALLLASASLLATVMPGRAGAKPAQAVTDTTVLAMVNDRPITVRMFRSLYFAAPLSDRPQPDSLGRLEYLNSLVTREVLAITALGIDRPLDFPDRNELRQARDITLANALYQHMVEDSVRVTEADLRAAFAQFGHDLRLRQLRFSDRATAEAVRRELIAGTTTWEDAAKTRAVEATDPAWVRRKDVSQYLALNVFDLRPGQLSRVMVDGAGAHLYQALDRRDVDPPAYAGLRRFLWIELRSAKAVPYVEELDDRVRREMGAVYDTTNIRWVASQMGDTRGIKPGPNGATMEVAPKLPDFSDEDLDRVLVRWNDGQLTLRDLLPKYTAKSPLVRGSLDTFEALRAEIDGAIFGPTMARLSEHLGFDKDSVAQRLMQRKLEGIQVGHLYSDSVESKIRPTDQEIRAFYDDHPEYFNSIPRVRYAVIPRPNREEGMAVLRRLRAGDDPAAILLADSLAGRPVGTIQMRASNEHGPYQETLFNDLLPGESTIIGPHGDGSYAVLKVLARYPSKRLPFDQVRSEVTKAVQNLQSDALLKQLVARHARGMKIVKRPELLMSIDMTDPADEIALDD